MLDGEGQLPSATLRRVFDSPLLGWAPWVALSVLVGPGRFVLSVTVAVAMSFGFIAVDRVRGRSLKVLNVIDVTSFVAFLLLGLSVTAGTRTWLETWFGEISNLTFALVAFGSMLARRPITSQYSRESTDPADWEHPRFLRTNYVITAVWGGAFVLAGLVALHGDAVLHNNDNLWTAWILQIAFELAAAEFTIWYPQREMSGGSIPVAMLLLPLAAYLTPVGILSVCLDAAPTTLGVTFIATGVAATAWLGQKSLGSVLSRGAQTAAL